MNNVKHYLQGKTLGLGNTHPDDHAPHANLLWAAHITGAPVHEVVQTKGRNAGDNFRANEHPRFSVARGDREHEGRASARHMGIRTYVQYDAVDGRVADREEELAQVTAAWTRRKRVDVLATLATRDHADHDAMVRIARRAAALLIQTGYEVDLLELQPRGTSDESSMRAEATPNSMAMAFTAAALNRSQFEISEDVSTGWPIVPGGYTMEPRSFDRLTQYPVLEDATYRYIPAGQLAIAAASLTAPAAW